MSWKWFKLILPHALWALLGFVLLAAATKLWWALGAPVFGVELLLYGEIKEEEGRRKALGLPTGTIPTIKEVLLSQSRTRQQRSEWLWMGALGGAVYDLVLVFLL